MRYNFAADSFYIMKLCSRLFVLYCRSRPKDDKSRYFDPHFEDVRGSVEPRWMARWEACTEFLLSIIELLFLGLSLTVEAQQGKMCQNSLPSGGGRSLAAKISGGRCRPWGIIFFGFCNTTHILLSNSANCTALRAVVLTEYRRVTDGQTDGIAVASTALAMRALRRAVKTDAPAACATLSATRPFHFVHTARVLQREGEMLASTCLYWLYAWLGFL